MSPSTAKAAGRTVITADTAGTSVLSLYSLIPSAVRSTISILRSTRQSADEVVTTPSSRFGSEQPEPVSKVPCTPSLASERDECSMVPMQHFDLTSSRPDPSASGVDWVTAGAGVRLWLSARAQQESTTCDPTLLRSMHIDALKYMCMALPSDLSSSELKTIRTSLPAQVSICDDQPSVTVATTRPNLLRQGVAQAVCWIIALILIIVPLLVAALDRLLTYERKHRVTRRLLDGSASVTKALGERGLDFGDTLVRFRDTPLGRAWLDSVAWTLEGVAGGLNDGLMRSAQGGVRLLE